MSSDKKKSVEKSSILDQWRNRKNAGTSSNHISPRPTDAPLLASSGQKRLWLLQQLYPDNPFYQYAHLYRLEGEVQLDRLQTSFQRLVLKHEILRTNFIETSSGLELKINADDPFVIENLEADSPDEAVRAFALRTFDLSHDQLIRMGWVEISANEHWLVLSMHHIIGDRGSLLILQQELFADYNQATTTPLPLQYSDYAHWKNNKEISTSELDYWQQQLSGRLPILSLPMAKPQPQKVSFEGETIAIALTPSLSAGVQKIALQHKTTKFVILLAAFKVLLYRYSGQSDLLIGSPFSNRDSVQLEKLIGFFNETVVLRSRMDDNVSFSQFVNQLKQTNLDALAHKNVPFEMLVKTLQVERNGSNPIFQVMFVYNNSSTSAFSNLDFEIEDTAIDLGVSKFDLTLFATDHQDYLELAMEYATDRYDRASVEQLLSHLQVILHSAIEQPEQLISKLDVLSSVEKEKILVNWNKTLMPEPVHTSIHAMIEARALEVPDEKAVVFEDSFLTYAQLMEQADSVANVLMDCHVERPRLLGLYTERSTAMIVGLLGILKAGAAYLPLDPDYPEER
ncbi:MAG: condensation domain-containing protein, partial [Bacteroidota bacterium]